MAKIRSRLDHEERQRQLANACAYLIATQGYSNTSVRDVAARVGISTGTLLHHFRTKEQMLVATLLSVSEEFQQHAQEVSNNPRHDPVQRLRALVRALLDPDRHALGWQVWIAFWHEAATNPELATVASERTDMAESFFTTVIEEGQQAGLLRPGDAATNAAEITALVDGVAIRLYGEPGRWKHARAVKVVNRLIDDWLVVA
jgi:AcrR family transcriptional regulator